MPTRVDSLPSSTWSGRPTLRQPHPLHQQIQARHKAEKASPLYSQSGELQVALEKQFWEDLELILVQAPERGKEKENEEMSRGHETGSRVFIDPTQSIHQQVLKASRSFIMGCSARGRHILSCKMCSQVGDKRQREVESRKMTCLLSLSCHEPQRDVTQ